VTEADRVPGERRALAVLGACFSLALFAFLAADVVGSSAPGWDKYLFARLYSGASDWPLGDTPGQDSALLSAALPLLYRVGYSGTLVALVCAVVVALLLLRLTRAAAFFAAAVAVAVATPFLKDVFGRPSPFPVVNDPAFPSGHAVASMAIAAGAFAVLGGTRVRWPVLFAGTCLVLAVGVAVIADGGHWPSDVLAGWCVSLFWVSTLRAVVGDPLRIPAVAVPVPEIPEIRQRGEPHCSG
jgi:membrane-associated phospholipid phosphatase